MRILMSQSVRVVAGTVDYLVRTLNAHVHKEIFIHSRNEIDVSDTVVHPSFVNNHVFYPRLESSSAQAGLNQRTHKRRREYA